VSASSWNISFGEILKLRPVAQALAHPYTLAVIRHWAAMLHQRRRDAPAVQAQADALLTLATVQGFPFLVALGCC
jgi:hypothetical protein